MCISECYTVPVLRMAHRKWKETQKQPGTVGTGNMLGCCFISFHFLWAILSTKTVHFSCTEGRAISGGGGHYEKRSLCSNLIEKYYGYMVRQKSYFGKKCKNDDDW